MSNPPKASVFCSLLASARYAKLPGWWFGSIYRHHPCGMVVGPLILSNEWNTNNYCYASFMTEPGAMTKPSNHPASRGGDPHPHPVNGEEFQFYKSGRWVGEDGPWRALLLETIERIEVQLDERSLASEWKAAHDKIDRLRREAQQWEARRQIANRCMERHNVE